jgi:hypothetical protein
MMEKIADQREVGHGAPLAGRHAPVITHDAPNRGQNEQGRAFFNTRPAHALLLMC